MKQRSLSILDMIMIVAIIGLLFSINASAEIYKTVVTDKAKSMDYTTFTISSQKNQDTLWNANSLPVSVNITPTLQKGDTIQFLFDGVAVIPAAASTSARIPKIINDKTILVRGSHTLSANVLNANGDVLKTTPSITIYLQYTSLNQPNKR